MMRIRRTPHIMLTRPPARIGLSWSLVAMLALLLAGNARPATAGQDESLPARVTLAQVLELLDQRSPRTIAERARVDIVAADRITARTLPNPSISYGGLRLAAGANLGAVMQHELVVDQPLLLYGVRGSRRDVADLNVSAEQARVAADLADRRLQVRQAFVSLVARQQGLRILQDSLSELQRAESVVRGRADEGDRSQYDVLRIETERRTLEVELMNAATEVTDASGRLAALLGFPGWLPEADGTLDPTNVPTDFNVLWDLTQERRPALVAVRQRQNATRGALLLTRRERLPVPALTGGVVQTRDERSTSAFFGLSLPLPLFDRSQGAIARADAELRAETLALEAEMAEARAEVERTRATLIARRQALGAVQGDILQRVPTLRRMAEDAYREGQGGILELLDASRSLRDIQLLHVRQLEMTRLAEEDVIATTGLDAQ
jgi:outer membrane protein, heavy metal efflux system